MFEALRRRSLDLSQNVFIQGACFHSLTHEAPARLDFYKAQAVDGRGLVINERLFAVELTDNDAPILRGPEILGNLIPTDAPTQLPSIASLPEETTWLNEQVLKPFIDKVRTERRREVELVANHVEIALREVLQRIDGEIGKVNEEKERGVPGAEGRLAQAEARHAEGWDRRARRREELKRQQYITLQGVERLASVLILPHPERESPDVRGLRPNPETEMIAMRVVMEYEQAQGRQVSDVHQENLGYDITSLDPASGDLRLIEIKGLAAATGSILLTPNEKRVAEDRRDYYWLYIVTDCASEPRLQEPIKDPARFPWSEVAKVQHYQLSVNSLKQPADVQEH